MLPILASHRHRSKLGVAMIERRGWPLPAKIAFVGFVAIAAFFLLTEHLAHTLGALPYVLILICPLMHLFMHHGGDHMSGSPPSASDLK